MIVSKKLENESSGVTYSFAKLLIFRKVCHFHKSCDSTMEKDGIDSPEQQKESIHTFIQFLITQQLLPFLDKKIYEKNHEKFLLLKKFLTLFDCIQYYFHVLQESTLKLLISNALEYRTNLLKRQEQEKTSSYNLMKDEQFLGNWGIIIDVMKIILQQRRDLASNNFQQLISYGREGKPETVDFFLKQLFSNGFIDHLFLSILEDTMKALESHGGKEKNEENYYMLQYFENTISGMIHEREEKEKALEEAEKRKESKSVAPIAEETTKVSPDTNSLPVEKLKIAESSNLKPSSVPSSSNPVVASSWMNEEDLISYSQTLNSLIKECNGNMSLLQDKLLDLLGLSSFSYESFLFVLKENQKACQTANYANKLKLLQFIEQFLEKNNHYLGKTRSEIEKEQLATALQHNDINSTLSSLSTYHAPQFIDDSLSSRNKQETKKVFTYQPLFAANHLLFNENISNPTITIPSNNKKKKVFRKNMKIKKAIFLKEINQFLYENGFVIIDSFLSLDQVKRVRIESNLFRHFYDQAEIWVGKKADIGAHLTVPSVRGDRVLWVCGGHNVLGNTSLHEDSDEGDEEKDGEKKGGSVKGPKQHYAPEGVSRFIKTAGEIEPCKLEVKASAPIRKFTALKECITTYDNFMDELKNFQDDRKAEDEERERAVKDGKENADGEEKVAASASGKTGKGENKPLYDNPIHHIYERSDAMLSIYPSDGTRFANHIDNTTQDGRRLSCIAYFNPDWKEEMGGALRIKPKRHNYSTPSSSVEGKEVRKYPNFQDYDAIDIYPYAGRMIIFFSSQIEHEVLPTFGDRHALTIWYYDKYERKDAIERAKAGDNLITKKLSTSSAANPTQSIEIQKQAKQFIADLMGGDDVSEDGGNPTEQELQQLTKKVEMLSDDALEIIASITGAPSVSSFREGFPLLTVTDLKAMRALFRRMGLQS
jgi:hypothetical protein